MERIDLPPGSLEKRETRFDVRSKCNPGAHFQVDEIEKAGHSCCLLVPRSYFKPRTSCISYRPGGWVLPFTARRAPFAKVSLLDALWLAPVAPRAGVDHDMVADDVAAAHRVQTDLSVGSLANHTGAPVAGVSFIGKTSDFSQDLGQPPCRPARSIPLQSVMHLHHFEIEFRSENLIRLACQPKESVNSDAEIGKPTQSESSARNLQLAADSRCPGRSFR